MTARKIQLTEALAGLMARVNARGRKYLEGMVAHYVVEVVSAGGEPPEDVARALHEAADRAIDAERGKDANGARVRCTAGCAACCRIEVSIWPQEAEVLVRLARERGIYLDRDRLRRQAARTYADWSAQEGMDRACPFLGPENNCEVYEDRPLSCRKYFVVSEPEFCDTKRHPGHRVRRWSVPEAEVIESVARTIYGGGTMASELLKVLEGVKK